MKVVVLNGSPNGDRGEHRAFTGKYAAALSTSIHYFDHTAHNYIQSICADLGMHFIESYSPDMVDLLKESERRHLASFGQHFLEAIQTQAAGRPARLCRRYPRPLPFSALENVL